MEPHQNNLLSDPNSHYITSLYCLILHHSERYKKIFMCKQKVTDSVQSAADSQSVQSVTGRRSRSQISSLFLFIHQISDLTEVCYSCGFIKRSGHRVPRWLLVHSNESCSPGSHATDVFQASVFLSFSSQGVWLPAGSPHTWTAWKSVLHFFLI